MRRYYYAVATFDSAAAAGHVCGQIDGTEFERTANVFDISFVPDDTSFEEDIIHEEATESTVAAVGPAYQGVEFVTDVRLFSLRRQLNPADETWQALRHSKVKLTWDADDPHRKSKITSYLSRTTDAKGKGKSKLDILDDDIKAYLASSSDEDGEAAQSVDEDEDDFFEKIVTEKSKPKLGKRDQMRNLFGLDGGKEKIAQSLNWDGGKGRKKGDGGMEITFAPALTDKKKLGDKFGPDDSDSGDDDDEAARKKDETAIETYKRKERERRERKKAERKAKKDGVVLAPVGEEGPEYGGVDNGAGGFDDDFFAGKDDDEMFAAFDAGDDLDEHGKKVKGAAIAGKSKDGEQKLSKRERREAKEAEEEADKVAQASLALMLDSEDDDEVGGGKHFDMRSILKAEKNAGKKKIGKGKKGKNIEILQKDGFEIDVKDERFKGVYEDSNYAIDPTNSRFVPFSHLLASYVLNVIQFPKVAQHGCTAQRRTEASIEEP